MSRCVTFCTRALCAGVLASLIMPFGVARTEDCLTEPNREAAQGSRWFYHVDRATNRKCWYLVGAGARTPATPPTEQPPAPEPAPPAFGSLFSWWTAGLSSTPASPPEGAIPDARQTGDSKSHPPRQLDAQAAPQTAPAPKPHRTITTHAVVGHGDEQGPLTDQERDALFQEFLRWKGNQKQQ